MMCRTGTACWGASVCVGTWVSSQSHIMASTMCVCANAHCTPTHEASHKFCDFRVSGFGVSRPCLNS